MSWCFWLVTLSVKLNTTPHRKDVSSPVKMTVLCFPTWALTSVKRKGPWTLCVVISEGTISPPPRLRTCIPPILPPDVQIVSTFMQVPQSHFVSSRAVMRIWKIQQIVTNICFYLFTRITSVEDKDAKVSASVSDPAQCESVVRPLLLFQLLIRIQFQTTVDIFWTVMHHTAVSHAMVLVMLMVCSDMGLFEVTQNGISLDQLQS